MLEKLFLLFTFFLGLFSAAVGKRRGQEGSGKPQQVPSGAQHRQSCWQYQPCTHVKGSRGRTDLPSHATCCRSGCARRTPHHSPCLPLLLDIVTRGRWYQGRVMRQGQSIWQVRPPLLADDLLGSNLSIKQLIVIPCENTKCSCPHLVSTGDSLGNSQIAPEQH